MLNCAYVTLTTCPSCFMTCLKHVFCMSLCCLNQCCCCVLQFLRTVNHHIIECQRAGGVPLQVGSHEGAAIVTFYPHICSTLPVRDVVVGTISRALLCLITVEKTILLTCQKMKNSTFSVMKEWTVETST
jgi:hypothetical protein